MADRIADLYARLNPDPARDELGFSPEMAAAQDRMFAPGAGADDISQTLAEWLNRHQPCLFGRMSAKAGLIRYCILNEADLLGADEAICDKIQAARTHWTREGFEGSKSGFIVLAVSPKLARAAPNDVLKRFVARLCALYLLEEEIEEDEIYLDEVFLENPAGRGTTWKWLAGVNVFSANGDRRWWQDHRIPGGLGFSVNSVGHMVKSKRLLTGVRELEEKLGEPGEDFATTKVGDTLESALEYAMRTIYNATQAVSGKATELLPLPDDLQTLPVTQCPAQLPRFLADKNYCEYQGYYHTDVTIPSDYFLPDVERPADVDPLRLDFTYLINNHVDNPSYRTVGSGRRIRGAADSIESKILRAEPLEVPVDHFERPRRRGIKA
jgi:hypothetical protein